jgi:hypothetical protein
MSFFLYTTISYTRHHPGAGFRTPASHSQMVDSIGFVTWRTQFPRGVTGFCRMPPLSLFNTRLRGPSSAPAIMAMKSFSLLQSKRNKKESFHMKKIMGLMLGLSLVLGTATVFAQDTAGSSDTATHKAKHSKKSKKSKKDTGAMSGDTSTTK